MYKEYCTGCGLCASVKKAPIVRDEHGFRIIESEDTYENFLKKVCPTAGKQCIDMQKGEIWGRQQGVFLSFSANKQIRHDASSGGVLTSLLLFLLDTNKVDAIIQIKQNDKDPIETEIVCSDTHGSILKCMGSRYSASMPLETVADYIVTDKTYAFVGKPCDVIALRNYLKINPSAQKSFPYMLSFFCAGAPSRDANISLLNKVGCEQKNCVSLTYRGNGWPGFATAIDSDGNEHKTTYRNAWRDTLGRDIRKICRFCLDGIGEMADISCGDAWYLNENHEPIFDEAEGRNVVFCRTEKGRNLFDEAVTEGYITKMEYPNYEKELPFYQAYQFDRRAAMSSTFLAMKLAGKATPCYDNALLKSYAKKIGFKHKFSRFKGTLKRIYERKI